MKTVTYTCDVCGLPIDGESGPQAAKMTMLALDLVELQARCAINNPLPDPLHYHRYCFEQALKRLRD